MRQHQRGVLLKDSAAGWDRPPNKPAKISNPGGRSGRCRLLRICEIRGAALSAQSALQLAVKLQQLVGVAARGSVEVGRHRLEQIPRAANRRIRSRTATWLSS